MLQDMDTTEASWVSYVKVSTFTHLEQRKTSHFTVNKSGIVRLTIPHDLIVPVSYSCPAGNSLRQKSSGVLSLKQFLCIHDNHAMSAVVHLNSSLLGNNRHQTALLRILGLWETLQLEAMHSRTHLEYNAHVGSNISHSHMNLTI